MSTLHERLREMKARAAIRKWEARQAELAGGVWLRLQLLLAQSRRALLITADEANALREAGFEPHPVGMQLEPAKSLFVIAEESVPPEIAGAEIDLRDVLRAPAAILIPFAS